MLKALPTRVLKPPLPWLVLTVFAIGVTNFAAAEESGLAWYISTLGSMPQCRDIFDLSDGEQAAFKSQERELMAMKLSAISDDLKKVHDDPTNQAWIAKYGPRIRRVNYGLWQRAATILKTDDRIKKYHRVLLQYYLRSEEQLRCVAALAGVELTWQQLQTLKAEMAGNPRRVENVLAKRRRQLEEEILASFMDRATLKRMRGEEFLWESAPPNLDELGYDPFNESIDRIDQSRLGLANHPQVAAELGIDSKSSIALTKLLSTAPPDEVLVETLPDLPPFASEDDFAARQQAQLKRKRSEEAALEQKLRSVLTKGQYERLLQIIVQQRLRSFDYVGLVRSHQGGQLDDSTNLRIVRAVQEVKLEMRYALAQLTLDFNARSFDEVAGTNLATSLGKLETYAVYGGYDPRVRLRRTRTADAYRAHYGAKATTELKIPTSLARPSG